MKDKLKLIAILLLIVFFLSGLKIYYIKFKKSNSYNLTSLEKVEEILPSDARCNGNIVSSLPPLKNSTLDNPTTSIDAQNPLVVKTKVVNCIQLNNESNKEEGFLIEKVMLKNGLVLIIKKHQNSEFIVQDYIFILPGFFHKPDDIKFWYKKTHKLFNEISKVSKDKSEFNNLMIQLNKVSKQGYIEDLSRNKEKFDFRTEIYYPYNQKDSDINETIILDIPEELKDKKGSFIKLSRLIGPM